MQIQNAAYMQCFKIVLKLFKFDFNDFAKAVFNLAFIKKNNLYLILYLFTINTYYYSIF